MSDLISRKALVHGLMENYEKCMTFHDLLTYIQEQPVAYDVDKVIEQLDEAYNNGVLGEYHGIVRGGGKMNDITKTIKAIKYLKGYLDDVVYTSECIEHHKLAIAALEAQQADMWIPVTERLPTHRYNKRG